MHTAPEIKKFKNASMTGKVILPDPMDSHDEPQAEHGNGVPALPSVQERRMQLEAFQAGTAASVEESGFSGQQDD